MTDTWHVRYKGVVIDFAASDEATREDLLIALHKAVEHANTTWDEIVAAAEHAEPPAPERLYADGLPHPFGSGDYIMGHGDGEAGAAATRRAPGKLLGADIDLTLWRALSRDMKDYPDDTDTIDFEVTTRGRDDFDIKPGDDA
jgi:hypothetical protein